VRLGTAVHERSIPLCAKNDKLTALCCSINDGPQCVGLSRDNVTFDFYNMETGKRTISLGGTKGHRTIQVVVPPNNSKVFASSLGFSAIIWDAQTRRPKHIPNVDGQWIQDLLFSSTGNFLAVVTKRSIRVWDANIMRPVSCMTRQQYNMWHSSQVSISADDDMLVATTGGADLHIWPFPYEGKEIVITCPQAITSVRFLPIVGSKLLVCGCANGKLVVRDLSQKDIVLNHCWNTTHKYSVSSLAFSCDGRLLASSAHSDSICVWDMKSNICLHTFTPFRDILRIAFHPSGDQLAACSKTDYFLWTICEWSDHKNHLFGQKLKSVIYTLMCVKTYFIIHPSCDVPQLSMQLWLDIFHSLAQFSSYDAMSIEKY
jgi:WD40 repeat protein